MSDAQTPSFILSNIHVCPLSKITETIAETGAGHLITLMNTGSHPATPAGIESGRHLKIAISDIVARTEGSVLPATRHVKEIFNFAQSWDRRRPLLIHCYAGVSRSTAAAYICVLLLDPARDERALAQELRRASPTATPNIRLIRLADRLLGRGGRMVRAIESIGRGTECFEGVPFRLAIGSCSRDEPGRVLHIDRSAL
jgi:predicted protein tyrosine phosphatase